MCPLHCFILQDEHLEGARSSVDLKELTSFCGGVHARGNAFLRCENLGMPKWVRWLPRSQKDDDEWADDFFAALN